MYCINCSFPIFFLLHTNNRVSYIKKSTFSSFVFFHFVFALGNIVNRSEIKDHYSNETSELHLIFFLLCMFSRATNETKCIRKRSELLMGIYFSLFLQSKPLITTKWTTSFFLKVHSMIKKSSTTKELLSIVKRTSLAQSDFTGLQLLSKSTAW